jgi:hypothetical protein
MASRSLLQLRILASKSVSKVTHLKVTASLLELAKYFPEERLLACGRKKFSFKRDGGPAKPLFANVHSSRNATLQDRRLSLSASYTVSVEDVIPPSMIEIQCRDPVHLWLATLFENSRWCLRSSPQSKISSSDSV